MPAWRPRANCASRCAPKLHERPLVPRASSAPHCLGKQPGDVNGFPGVLRQALPGPGDARAGLSLRPPQLDESGDRVVHLRRGPERGSYFGIFRMSGKARRLDDTHLRQSPRPLELLSHAPSEIRRTRRPRFRSQNCQIILVNFSSVGTAVTSRPVTLRHIPSPSGGSDRGSCPRRCTERSSPRPDRSRHWREFLSASCSRSGREARWE